MSGRRRRKGERNKWSRKIAAGVEEARVSGAEECGEGAEEAGEIQEGVGG